LHRGGLKIQGGEVSHSEQVSTAELGFPQIFFRAGKQEGRRQKRLRPFVSQQAELLKQ
jgi:hypothetical protein